MDSVSKAIGYIRVSTEEQSREGISLDAQKEKIRAYCSIHDLELVCIQEDAGISGKAVDNRPGFQECLRMLEDGQADALVVLKLDRMSRSTKDVLELSEAFQGRGWQLHSISERLDTSSAAGRFVLTILAALAQMEREQIGERTSMALQHKKARGERLGTTPYGYETIETSNGKELIPLDSEQAVLRRIADLREEGWYLSDIAGILNVEGIPTKRGGKWHVSTISYLLRYIIPKAFEVA